MVRVALNPNAAYRPLSKSGSGPGVLLAETCERLVELHRRNATLTHAFVGKLWRLQEACRLPYTLEIALCILSDLQAPGPQELSKRYGISKQAISKSILDRLAALKLVDKSLATGMRKYAQGAIKAVPSDEIDREEERLPDILPLGCAHISTPKDLTEYLRAKAVAILTKHQEDEQLVQAYQVRSALGALARNFLAHTTKPSFDLFKSDVVIEDLIGELVYHGEDHGQGFGHDGGSESEEDTTG